MGDNLSNRSVRKDLSVCTVTKAFRDTIPRVANVAFFSIQPKGSIVYDLITNLIYYSDGLVWIPICSSSSLVTVVDTVTCAPKAVLDMSPVSSITQTDIDIALAPRGTGSFSLDVPDNTAVGGNCRGDNAVDLQMIRSSAISVASGTSSPAAVSSLTRRV